VCNSVYHYDDEDLQCVCDREGEVCVCLCVYVCLRVYESVSYLVALLGHFIMRMLCILTRFYNWAIWAQKYI